MIQQMLAIWSLVPLPFLNPASLSITNSWSLPNLTSIKSVMPSCTFTILLGFLLPWTWGISSWLLQQSTATAHYLGRGEGYLKILQARLQQYMNRELPDIQAGFRKGRETRDQIANICWRTKKRRVLRKTSISALLTMPKALTVWITTYCGKFFRR